MKYYLCYVYYSFVFSPDELSFSLYRYSLDWPWGGHRDRMRLQIIFCKEIDFIKFLTISNQHIILCLMPT